MLPPIPVKVTVPDDLRLVSRFLFLKIVVAKYEVLAQRVVLIEYYCLG